MDTAAFEGGPHSGYYLPSPVLTENDPRSEKEKDNTNTQTGWTFGASLFGAIFGFAILKPLSKALPRYLGGGYFGPKEDNVAQVAATSAGSLGLLFTSGFPAAYQLGLLQASPIQDIDRLFAFTICCAFFGLAFSIPLRKFYILKLKLVFPTGVATAYTIQSCMSAKTQ
ncbi:OPT oligopeptide transporter protein-domain-containing protein [Butyriboletus roseoflavus]|nr:OPT oligopeptide transporter protein-domain-containing protein [Butyriboletus roseoflavus]